MTKDKNEKHLMGVIKNGKTKFQNEKFSRTPEQEAEIIHFASELTKFLSKNLARFEERNKNTSHINYKMCYLLYDPWIFANAYAKISKNKGALTRGVPEDDQIMKWFGQGSCLKIADSFRENRYSFLPTRRVLIPKPGKKTMRPIDTPSQRDRIVQEAIRGILDAVFEPEFREFETMTKNTATNFGFRPNLSCMDAIKTLKYQSQRCTYVIEGDIVGAYNNIDRKILLSLINRRIKDKKFLEILKNLLDSKVLFEDKIQSPILGTPQGGIVSPLLFNIYMFEFDKFMYKRFVQPMNSSKAKPQRSPVYQSQGYRMKCLRREMKKVDRSSEEYKRLKKEYAKIEKSRISQPSYTVSSLPKRACYVRYADDWVLTFTGTKAEAIEMKKEISNFLLHQLKLELDENKTLISNLSDGFCFLGFSIKMWTPRQMKTIIVTQKIEGKYTRSRSRTTSRKIHVTPDKARIIRNLKLKGCCKQDMFPIGIRAWALLEPARIVERYNSMMRGLAAYYRECDNHYALNQVSYILQYSCAKTIATRQHITMKQVFAKYGKNLRVTYTKQIFNKKKDSFELRTYSQSFMTYTDLKRSGFMYAQNESTDFHDPFGIHFYPRTKMKLFCCCCICNSTDKVQLHHLKSLRSIPMEKRKEPEYIRMRFNRLQVPVCYQCHLDITHGRFDSATSVRNFYDDFIAEL